MSTPRRQTHNRVMRYAKHPCTARVGGFMCGDKWREITYKRVGRHGKLQVVRVRCYVNGHLQDRRGRMLSAQLEIKYVPAVSI